jgi:hypothetical protein
MNNEFKPKSFWERPEGTTGMVLVAGAAVGLAFAAPFLMSVFASMITLLGQAITITVLGAVLFALIMVLSNKKFRTLVSYGFKSVMRSITGVFVEIDPIGIMKSYIDDLKEKQKTMDASIDRLKGQISVCEKQVNQNATEYDRQMTMAKVAKEKQMSGQFSVASRQAGRLDRLNKESLKPLLLQMQTHYRALQKYKEVTETVIQDLGNEVKAQEMQRKMILESHGAMRTAKKILMGGTSERELFDQAMEYVVNDYGMKMGEIENFIENSKGFVEGLDLQNGVYEEEALKKLQAWENKADSILLGNGKQQMLEQQTFDSPIYGSIGAPSASQVDYANLISSSSSSKSRTTY